MKSLLLYAFFFISSCHAVTGFLIFPQQAPTRTQFVWGFGVPLDSEDISMTTGYVLKAIYLLPYKASQLIPMFLNRTLTVERRVRREDTKTRDLSVLNARWITYGMIEGILKGQGLEGRPCLLRAICEAAQWPFTHRNGILGEILHVILTPSTSKEKVLRHFDHEYFYAEDKGRGRAPCERIFSDCPLSVLEIFSQTDELVTNLVEDSLK